jgi:hypothetical protein
MTRYVVMVENRWVTAVYDSGKGIGFTQSQEDASSWVTYERAIAAARTVAQSCNCHAAVHSVDEPAYPQSWK